MVMNHVREPFHSLLNDIREATHTLQRCAVKGAAMSEEPMKIIIEQSPWPTTVPQYRWWAYYEGREDELSKAGKTPDEALSRFLIAVTNRDEPEID
jgi:hypothetical protein